MQLSQKQKAFSPFFSAFFESTSNFKHCKRKMTLQKLCTAKITDSERRG